MGGQRLLIVGYTGTLAFLDRFTNTLLESKYASYRAQARETMGIKEGA
jgi:nitrogenase molybdenum-iron protein NifN